VGRSSQRGRLGGEVGVVLEERGGEKSLLCKEDLAEKRVSPTKKAVDLLKEGISMESEKLSKARG